VDDPAFKLSLRVVAATALASGLTPLNSTMLSVALRPIGATFHTGDATLTRSLVTSYLVTSIVMQAPCGKIGDQLGHRRALRLGQLVFGVGAILAVAAPSLVWLVIARVAMAAAGALIVPSAMALLRTELPPELRGRAFGVFGATMALAAALGPLIGGQIAFAVGWRAVFAVNLVLLPVSVFLAGDSPSEPEPRAAKTRPTFDFLGTVLLAAALGSLVLGVGRRGALNLPLLVASPVLLAAFVMVERRHPAPVVDLSLLTRPVFVASGTLIALQNLAMYALLFELPTTCGIVLGAGANRTGGLLVAITAPMVVLAPVAGRMADAYGARKIAVLGALFAVAGIVALIVVPLVSIASAVPGLVLAGIGLGLSGAPAQSAGMSAAPADRGGVAAGMMATMRYLGGVAGTLALGIVLAPTDDPALALVAHRRALTIFLVALVLATGCALCLPTGRPATKVLRKG
jgi:MFS family permease